MLEILKTTKGRLGCAAIVLITLLLCGAGFLIPKTLPEIALAAEKLHFFGLEVPNPLPATWLSMAVLIIVSFLATRKMEEVPSGLQNAVEAIVEVLYNFIEGVAGEKAPMFFPLVATFFFFIIISNWMGLMPGFGSIGLLEHAHHGGHLIQEIHILGVKVGLLTAAEAGEHETGWILLPFLRSANADLNTTIALAIVSVAATQYFGLRTLGLTYLGKFFTFKGSTFFERPVNTFVGLLELASEFIKIISFSFRLFGNIFAGEVLLIVIGYLVAFVASLPFMLLEIFVGFVQALIFAMLSLIFFMMATVHHDSHERH